MVGDVRDDGQDTAHLNPDTQEGSLGEQHSKVASRLHATQPMVRALDEVAERDLRPAAQPGGTR